MTLFGDSVAESLAYVPEARTFLEEGIDLRLELAPCRKLVPIGCAYIGVTVARPTDPEPRLLRSPIDLGSIFFVHLLGSTPEAGFS